MPTSTERAFVAFLNRRICKKSAAARKKELSFDRAEGNAREGMEHARIKEWNNDAVEVLEPETAQQYLRDNSHVKPSTPMRWVDTNKAEPWEDPKYKAPIGVVRIHRPVRA